jgi:LPXTG-motif cell wall-anchored protein
VQGKVNVWNTTLAQLNAIQNLNGSAPSSSAPLIINVTDAGSLNWSPGSYAALQNAVPAGASYVLWNFPNATSLNLTGGNALYGDLLAPNASVVDALGGANINGQVIAANFVHNGGGEVHYHPLAFSVDTACTDVVTTTTTDAATTTTTDAATTTTTDAATTTTTDAATTTTTDAATTTTTDAATTTTTDAATTTTTDAATTTTTDAATTTTTDAATTTTGLSGAGGSNTSTTSANGISNTTRSAGALPATGTESPSVLPFAALIVIAGTGIVLVARRRRIS